MSSTEDTKEKEESSTKENNWKTFGLQVLQAFINVLIIGLLSANFVYFTRINLDLFFPTEVNQRPYANETKNGQKLPPFNHSISIVLIFFLRSLCFETVMVSIPFLWVVAKSDISPMFGSITDLFK